MTPLVRAINRIQKSLDNIVFLPLSEFFNHGINIFAGFMEDNYVIEGEGEA